MGLFEDHLFNGSYPYLAPEQFVERCPAAAGADPEDENVIAAVQDASLVLFYLTGRQFNGTGETTVYPDCRCNECSPRALNLGLWPVTAITGVRIDGVDEDPDDFHVDEYKYIVRNDGEAFPQCGNWYAETGGAYDNADDRWVFEVTVEHGLTPPPLVTRATLALACSLYADSACNGDGCALPDRVTAVTRQGVSFEVADFIGLLTQGVTGIYPVDLAVKVFNPSKLQSPSFVWSPDLYRGKRRYT